MTHYLHLYFLLIVGILLIFKVFDNIGLEILEWCELKTTGIHLDIYFFG